MVDLSRRQFVKSTGLVTGGLAMGVFTNPLNAQHTTNAVLPRWKGFNILDFFRPDPKNPMAVSKEIYFKWMSDWGFDFIRVPMSYPYFLKFDRDNPIPVDRMQKFHRKQVRDVDQILEWADKYNLHVSLNMHRAPGFCVNAGFVEPYNLWKSEQALDDFCQHWGFWAHRYRKISPERISFDLLNEPCVREDMNDQHSKRTPVPGDTYRNLIVRAMDAIQAENPKALIIADGNNIGADVIPEITDLDIAQSCRGYSPQIISHYKASWVYKDFENLPQPSWPITYEDMYYDRNYLEDFYAPWVALAQQGIGVHCGECGCFRETPHDVFLAWFGDVLDIFKKNDIGFSLWEFKGSFGIMDSGRADVTYEDWYGHKLDRKLLRLLQDS